MLEDGQAEGALSTCGQVMGSYLHGLFDSEAALSLLCQWANGAQIEARNFAQQKEEAINRIADAIETHLDLSKLDL